MQTKLVGLTMELDLKAREYEILCNKLEQLKKNNIDPNDEKLLYMMQLFQKNHSEIVEINKEINKIKDNEEIKEYSYSNDIFKKKEKTEETYELELFEKGKNVQDTETLIEIKKETFFKKLISFIKGLFNKND